ncbi:YceI family protein [Mesonia sediminis]|uniref:YceI family protein n=1 Tax=Mesonia sediminis TaxID=1703946 RepID=A0ABW5SFT3_9FLAO
MKKVLLNGMVLAFLGLSTVACKNEAKNETNPKEAQEVAEAGAESATYAINAAESKIDWVGSKPAGNHTGTVMLSKGEFTVDGDKLSGGTVVIDMTSIDVTDLEGEDRDKLMAHLKGTAEGQEDHFFNVAEFPTAMFQITEVKEMDGKTMLAGNLTMKDISKNIEIPVNYEVSENKLTLKSEPFTIDRTKWNVNYASKSVFDDLKDKFVNDEIELSLVVIATK